MDIKWVEYQNMIKYLSQWIKHNVAIMSDRSFPNNPVELKVLMISTLIMNLVLKIRAKKKKSAAPFYKVVRFSMECQWGAG